jgi:hypothetical protein
MVKVLCPFYFSFGPNFFSQKKQEFRFGPDHVTLGSNTLTRDIYKKITESYRSSTSLLFSIHARLFIMVPKLRTGNCTSGKMKKILGVY